MQIAATTSTPVFEPGLNPNADTNRRLAQAARTLNEAGVAGAGREFSFSIDPHTKQAVFRIVDASTGELVEQFPSEYILSVAQGISENSSLKTAPAADKDL